MKQDETEKLLKVAQKFICECCHYNTSKKSSFDKHLSTDKHKIKKNETNMKQEVAENFICFCGKLLNSRTTLWRHKKKCNTQNSEITNDKELIMMLIKQNTQLIEQNAQLVKNGTHNISNSHNTNSNNKTFNLQFFLNETCKDAINIMDFVDSIKIQMSDLEKVGKIGYVEGISNIITSNLKALDENKRPVHCTDSKREVMYIKDEDKWEKENEEKLKLRKAIKYVAHKNIKMLSEFRTKYPDCLKSTSKVADQYNKLVFEAMGGKGDNDDEKENKIIKKISDVTTIDKEMY